MTDVSLKKWQYRTELIRYNDLPAVLNQAGGDGWEAFAVIDASDTVVRVFFKREVK